MRSLGRFLKKNWHWLFFACAVVLTLYMDVFVARFILDGDTSDFLYRSYTIAKENNLFTQNVYMTTEIKPFDSPAVFSVFFHFTNDWTLVRILGTVVMQAYYVAAFLYLCRQAHISRPSAVFAAGMLLLPFSTVYARIVLYHVHYILYLANAFWILGLTLHLFRAATGSGLSRRQIPHALLLGLGWFIVGCNGVRHMMILGIPMLAYAAFQLIGTLNEYRLENGRLTSEKGSLWKREAVCFLLILVAGLVCFMLGYLINTRFFVPYYGIENMEKTTFRPNLAPVFYTSIINGFLTAAGVRWSRLPIVGIRGASMIAALFSAGYLSLVSFRCFRKRDDIASRLVPGMLATTLITTLLIFLCNDALRYYELYFIPVLVWMIPTMASEWERLRSDRTAFGQRLLILAACASLIFQSAYSVLFIRTQNTQMDRWDGLVHKEMDTVDGVHDCVAFMRENGYTHAMIGYWYSNVMVEITDGELKVAPLTIIGGENPRLEMDRWGTSKSAFQPDQLPEKIVLFIPHDECEQFKQLFPQVEPVFDGWRFCGYLADAEMLDLSYPSEQ